jgi:hypothetical protein
VDGGLLGGILRALLQTAGDIEWASTEYWLLRRLLACLVVPANLEVKIELKHCFSWLRKNIQDLVMSCATLCERAWDSLPSEAEALVAAFAELGAG